MKLRIGRVDFDNYEDLFFLVEQKEVVQNGISILYNGNEYLLTSAVDADTDCICSTEIIKFYADRNTRLLKSLEKDNAYEKRISLNLIRFNLECFCVDTLINYQRYVEQAKTLPLDLNLYD